MKDEGALCGDGSPADQGFMSQPNLGDINAFDPLCIPEGSSKVVSPVDGLSTEVLDYNHEAWEAHAGRVCGVFVRDVSFEDYKQREGYQEERGGRANLFENAMRRNYSNPTQDA